MATPRCSGARAEAVDAWGYTSLHYAARGQDAAIIEILLAAGAPVNHQSKITGDTPLELAVKNGPPEILRLLLTAGADARKATAPYRKPAACPGGGPLNRGRPAGGFV